MDLLGAQRIPDPTTAGDFLRRFTEADIIALMDGLNGIHGEGEGELGDLRVDSGHLPEVGIDVSDNADPWRKALLFGKHHVIYDVVQIHRLGLLA